MKSKSQVTALEMIVATIALFVTFSILFPGFSYKSKWSDARILLDGRDTILTIDRIGKLYEYSFNSTSLEEFLSKIPEKNNTIVWSETEGTLKHKITIACNCTGEQIGYLLDWFSRLKINGRYIDITICYTNLGSINPCFEAADVLLIWGYKDITSYENVLQQMLAKEGGIVEIADFPNPPEPAQTRIFGIKGAIGLAGGDFDTISKPMSSSNVTYQAYKYFYHVPLPLKTTGTGVSTLGCNINKTGNFVIHTKNHTFSVCDASFVYFDTDGDGGIDTGPITTVPGQNNFTVESYKFILNYINSETEIGVSFRPIYNFTEFSGTQKITSDDNGTLVYVNNNPSSSIVVVNGTVGRTAWVADFSRNGLDKVGDDHKNLLLSLLLYASNKRAIGVMNPNLKTGHVTSYINTINNDTFEVYKFNLGLGYPF
jgi:hypothetical protein